MQVQLIRPGELGLVEIATWHSMQRATPSLFNPFLSPEFAIAVGAFRPDTYIAILTEGRFVIGFFPFERRRFNVGVPICGWMSPCQAVIHSPGTEWNPQELLQGCRLSAWQFDNLIVDQQSFKPYHAATVPAPIIDLADGFDTYYAKLQMRSPRFCRELARKTRKLRREAGDVHIVTDSRDTNILRRLVAWKSDQYRRTSHVDRFERRWAVGLLDTLLVTYGDYLSGLLSVLYAGDQPVAAQFGLRADRLLIGWFTAYDIRFAKYSPGLIQLMKMAEQLAATGVQEIHMGKGAKSYTENLKNGDIPLAEGIVTSRSVIGAADRVRGVSGRWAVRTVRHHPNLHSAVDWIFRRSGLSRRTYGRM
jgi:CelD/BcsL family acetyltransferase involved in cellulose biosynthesis